MSETVLECDLGHMSVSDVYCIKDGRHVSMQDLRGNIFGQLTEVYIRPVFQFLLDQEMARLPDKILVTQEG